MAILRRQSFPSSVLCLRAKLPVGAECSDLIRGCKNWKRLVSVAMFRLESRSTALLRHNEHRAQRRGATATSRPETAPHRFAFGRYLE